MLGLQLPLYLRAIRNSLMKSLFFILFFCLEAICSSAQIPVLLRVVRSEQSDTLGCNFVEELSRIVYNEIINGHAKLWDSPAKEVQITAPTLMEIEKSSGTNFIDEELIFIYEYWTNGKTLKSVTEGFSFSGKNRVGEEVSYGYVDYKDLQDAFLGVRVNSNANGNFSASIANYINTKEYAFNILQFAGSVVKGASESQQIRENFIGKNKFNPSYFTAIEIPQKMLTYDIDFDNSIDSRKLLAGKQLVNAIQTYLSENKEMFFNLGGERINSHLQQNKLNITRVTVKEIWKKTDADITYSPVSTFIYVNDSALSEIPYRDMIKMDMQLNGKSWIDIIKEKNFQVGITKINAQEIARRESYLYFKALSNSDWNKLIEYVNSNTKY